jgi:hypothetical protein
MEASEGFEPTTTLWVIPAYETGEIDQLLELACVAMIGFEPTTFSDEGDALAN